MVVQFFLEKQLVLKRRVDLFPLLLILLLVAARHNGCKSTTEKKLFVGRAYHLAEKKLYGLILGILIRIISSQLSENMKG